MRGQTDRDFELIVVDAGSKDGSADELANFDDIIQWSCSERDRGIFDGWNKGIARAEGDVIGLLNAGDAYHPEVIATVRATVRADAEANRSIYCGRTVMIDGGAVRKLYPNSLRRWLHFGIGVVHPAMFVGRGVYEAVGAYRDISIASDTDWVLRCVRHGVRFVPTDLLVYMEGGGVSDRNAIAAFSQYTDALVEHGFCGRLTGRALAHAYGVYKRARRWSSERRRR